MVSSARMRVFVLCSSILCAGCIEELTSRPAPTDIPPGGGAVLNLQALDWPLLGGPAAAQAGVGVVLRITDGAGCGTVASPVTTDAAGRATSAFIAAPTVTDTCVATVEAHGTRATPGFDEKATATITVHPVTPVGTTTGTNGVQGHQDASGDRYWIYTILSEGSTGPLKPGSQICILCPSPARYPFGFAPNAQPIVIEPTPGITYRVEPASSQCVQCMLPDKYEFTSLPPPR